MSTSEFQKKEFEFKATVPDDAPPGYFEGYAAAFGNIDHDGDIIDPGAFRKTVREAKGVFPILWQHDRYAPIGASESMAEDGAGLHMAAVLNPEVQQAREAHALLKQGAMRGLSIGYRPIKWKTTVEEGVPVRILKEIRLREVSAVTFPANEAATVTGMKARDVLLEAERLLSGGDDADPDEIKGAIEALTALSLKLDERGAAATEPETPSDMDTLRQWISDYRNRKG